jgi:hypothetical protein
MEPQEIELPSEADHLEGWRGDIDAIEWNPASARAMTYEPWRDRRRRG